MQNTDQKVLREKMEELWDSSQTLSVFHLALVSHQDVWHITGLPGFPIQKENLGTYSVLDDSRFFLVSRSGLVFMGVFTKPIPEFFQEHRYLKIDNTFLDMSNSFDLWVLAKRSLDYFCLEED